MDKAKLIDAGVDILSGWELFMDNGCGEIRGVYSDEYVTIVEELLKALCKELPELKVKHEIGTGFIEGKIVITDARDNYSQLLEWGE